MIQLLAILLYFVLVALLDWEAYSKLNKKWARFERARIVVGVLVVFTPAVLLIPMGVVDPLTFILLFCGFGVAGLITVGRDIDQSAEGIEAQVQKILED